MHIKKLTNKELLDQLEIINTKEPNVKFRPTLENQVVEFLRIYDLEPGDKAVSANLLYKLYVKTTVKPRTKTYFTRHIKTLFSHTGSGMIYINVDMYHIVSKLESAVKRKPHVINRRKNVRKEYESFTSHFNIKPGTIVLEGFILYYLYDGWVYKKRRDGVAEITFYDISKLYFDNVLKNDEMCFKIDGGVFKHLTENLLKEVRNGRKWRNEKFKKIKQKK